MTNQYDVLIANTARTYGLPARLLRAQVQQESDGDANAFRYEPAFFRYYILNNSAALARGFGPLAACSYGLMQILLETAYETGYQGWPEGLFAADVGLAWGAAYMLKLWKARGGTPGRAYFNALVRYNGVGLAATAYAESVYRIAGIPVPAPLARRRGKKSKRGVR